MKPSCVFSFVILIGLLIASCDLSLAPSGSLTVSSISPAEFSKLTNKAPFSIVLNYAISNSYYTASSSYLVIASLVADPLTYDSGRIQIFSTNFTNSQSGTMNIKFNILSLSSANYPYQIFFTLERTNEKQIIAATPKYNYYSK